MEPLNGHEAGNGGYSQGVSCTPPRRSPTRLRRPLRQCRWRLGRRLDLAYWPAMAARDGGPDE